MISAWSELGALRLTVCYLSFANLLGFVLMGIDKLAAVKHTARVTEATLFITAIIGGSAGCLLGMLAFRHKLRKWYFRIGMPLILLLQLGSCAVLLFFSPWKIVFL